MLTSLSARSWPFVLLFAGGMLALSGALVLSALGDEVSMKNGMHFHGRPAKLSSVAENPLVAGKPGPAVDTKPIVMLDDELRRTYFSAFQLGSTVERGSEALTTFKIPQRRAVAGNRVKSVGPLSYVEPFDEWGRRRVIMQTGKGSLDVVQAITEITPVWSKVEGVLGDQAIVWDMRIATSAIPRKTLNDIFKTYLDDKDVNHRLQIVKFYIQSDRYDDAKDELERAIKDFPELANLKDQVKENLQLAAKRMIEEIQRRRKSGQHDYALALLQKFPTKDVAGVTLLEVTDMIKEFEGQVEQKKKVIALYDELAKQSRYEEYKAILADIRKELVADLNINTMPRMADFLRLGNDDKLEPDQRLGICIVGWLTGSTPPGEENLEFALQMYRARAIFKKYMQENTGPERRQLLAELATQPGIHAKEASRIIAMMKPPRAPEPPPAPEQAQPQQKEQPQPSGPPGLFTMRIPGMAKNPDVVYHVQLPPEYDPYRRYPTIITLHGAGSSAIQQLDWWAGGYVEQYKMRTGQATRRGYIVIAPEWTRPHQSKYEFSPREHDVVLRSLRDACRKFSINTDRVYLSGHSMGGDCAWDVALSHPDLWAGAIPIVATSDKYIQRYFENAKNCPLYFVLGELDGNRLQDNAIDLDRYLTRGGYDCTVVEYLGRGHEHFIDEIQRIFDWCDLHERAFFPKTFEYTTMRTWDNYCYWIEVDQMLPNTVVAPAAWPPPAGVRATSIDAKINPGGVVVNPGGAKKLTVYLCPELINLEAPFTVNKARIKPAPAKEMLETLLEDVRTRGDRQHPFWLKVTL